MAIPLIHTTTPGARPIFTLFGVAVMCLGLRYLRSGGYLSDIFQRKNSCTQPVNAVIKRMEDGEPVMVMQSGRGSSTRTTMQRQFIPVYEYTYMGKRYSVRPDHGREKPFYSDGQNVTIMINPYDPRSFYDAAFERKQIIKMIAWTVGLFLFGLLMIYLVNSV